MALSPGDTAPDFALVSDDGSTIALADFAGEKLVVFFYPKAFTPGCTTESCDFRDHHETFLARGFQVVGVSPDSPKMLARFRSTFDLPFKLLSDPDHEMATAYGAWGVKKNYGREYEGLIRSTILIDTDGTVIEAYANVRAKGHVQRVVEATA